PICKELFFFSPISRSGGKCTTICNTHNTLKDFLKSFFEPMSQRVAGESKKPQRFLLRMANVQRFSILTSG
ncbi:MAG: hypothetical protein ACPG4S_03810, partial [Schleiferiaceae bacterium]